MTSDTSLPGVSSSGRRIRGCFLARPFQMPLSLRRTGFSSPIYADKADYCVIENGKVIGRIYEEWYTPPDLRWFWSVTAFHIDPPLEITATVACRRLRKLRRGSSRVGIECVRRVTKKSSSGSKPILREWRVTLMR